MPTTDSTASFIPKASMVKTGYKSAYKKAGVGFVFKITAFLLLISIVSFAGAFFYKKKLTTEIDELSGPLDRAKAAFDPLIISEIEKLMSSLNIIEDLVSKHRYPSRLFDFLEDLAYEEVRFTDMDYGYMPAADDLAGISRSSSAAGITTGINFELEGEAINYTAMAKQAEVFLRNPTVEDALFSDFALTQDGYVSFHLKLILNPSIIFYE